MADAGRERRRGLRVLFLAGYCARPASFLAEDALAGPEIGVTGGGGDVDNRS
jgi:hypothetical protein